LWFQGVRSCESVEGIILSVRQSKSLSRILYVRIPSSHICSLIKKQDFKISLFGLIASIPHGRAFVIPPILKRYMRCNREDLKILRHLANAITPKISNNGGYSFVLGLHIGLSEFLYNDTLPSIKEIEAVEDRLMFSSQVSIRHRRYADLWKIRKPDEYYKGFANTRTPFIILHGGLDPQTPWFYAPFYFEKVKRNNFQHLIKFPNFVHAIFVHMDEFCAQNIIVEWVNNPSNKPNTECIKNMPKLDWKGERTETKLFSKIVFGVEEMWEGL
jgi:hypothetical protein